MLKINFLGDSITEGCLATFRKYCFVSLVEKNLPCIAYNYGISGTSIAICPTASYRKGLEFVNRVNKMVKDVDLVFVLGGVNDYWRSSTPLGKKTDCSDKTFTGAVNLLCERLIKRYGKDKIVFILPLPKFDEGPISSGITNASLDDYRNIIKDCCKHYHLSFININKDLRDIRKYFTDGTHPNNLGHQVIANNIIKYIKKRFK